MNRLVACFSVGLAVLTSAAFGAGAQTRSSEVSLGTPTLLGAPQAPDLPMPTPLSTVPASPIPETQYSGPANQLPVVTVGAVELFQCVKYRDSRKIAPCAVPVIVQVPDPCTPKDRCCCTPRPCVNVEICVPNCGCPTVCVTRCGNKTRYDYGKYAIDIVSRNGRVIVDYDN